MEYPPHFSAIRVTTPPQLRAPASYADLQPVLALEQVHILDNPAPTAAAGPAPAFLDELPNQGPIHNMQVNELLRQLATAYLHDPNSQIAVVRVERGPGGPGQAHGVRVHITLDLL